jgi:hypothetical protein
MTNTILGGVQVKRLQFRMMMDGLVSTAVEKIRVLGREGAEEYIAAITKMVDDLDCFWNMEGDLSDTDWNEKLATAIKNH